MARVALLMSVLACAGCHLLLDVTPCRHGNECPTATVCDVTVGVCVDALDALDAGGVGDVDARALDAGEPGGVDARTLDAGEAGDVDAGTPGGESEGEGEGDGTGPPCTFEDAPCDDSDGDACTVGTCRGGFCASITDISAPGCSCPQSACDAACSPCCAETCADDCSCGAGGAGCADCRLDCTDNCTLATCEPGTVCDVTLENPASDLSCGSATCSWAGADSDFDCQAGAVCSGVCEGGRCDGICSASTCATDFAAPGEKGSLFCTDGAQCSAVADSCTSSSQVHMFCVDSTCDVTCGCTGINTCGLKCAPDATEADCALHCPPGAHEETTPPDFLDGLVVHFCVD